LFKELDSYLVGLPDYIGKFFFNAIDDGTKLVTVDKSVTTGADITFFLKPTNFLLDAMAAIRTGNFDYFV
jgi:hypothetical protein